MNKEKDEVLVDCMGEKERDNGDKFYCIKDETPRPIYEIVHDAVFGSVYSWDRLQYLTINNQDEIAELVQNYKVDIQTACAIWFDEQVTGALHYLKGRILAEETK